MKSVEQQLRFFNLDQAVESVFLDVVEGRLPASAEVIYKARNILWRFSTPHGGDVVVKSFHQPRSINAFVYGTIRKSKARRSYENAQRLLEAGFQTPAPLAYVEKRSDGRLRDSYYFSSNVEARTLRDIQQRPECDIVLRAAASELHRLHSLGFFLRDYSPGNVLYSLDADGKPTLFYVDLNRIDFNVRSHKKQMSNFGAIFFDPDTLVRFARFYAAEAGLDPETVAAEAVAAHHRYLNRKSRLRRLKQFLGIKRRR